MQAKDSKTQKETVGRDPESVGCLQQQAQIKKFRGQLAWTGDLDALRSWR